MRAIFAQSIHIKLKPSYLLLGLIGGVSIVACLILLGLPITLYLKFAVIALIISSSAYFIARDVLLLLPWSWQLLEVDSKGKLVVTNNRGQQLQPNLASSSFIHEALTILNFERENFRFALPPLILFAFANQQNESRRLRVWLRWFKHDQARLQDGLSASDTLDA